MIQSFIRGGGGGGSPTGPAGGDLTGNYPDPDIANNVVTNQKLATMPAYTIKGNNTNAVANPQDIIAQRFLLTDGVLNNGTCTIIDSNITVSSKAFVTPTGVGTLTGPHLRVTCLAGQCIISNAHPGDDATINVLIYY